MHEVNLYFLAIIPPASLQEQVMEVKTHFSDVYNCKAPLRSPAHITLQMPFLWKAEKLSVLIDQLTEFGTSQSKLDVELKGFGAFEPRIIFIDVVKNEPLQHFQKALSRHLRMQLGIFNDSYKNRGFRPHMTVAFRDLKKPLFYQAWEEFRSKPFQDRFEAKCFWLLQHDGKRWHQKTEIFLGY